MGIGKRDVQLILGRVSEIDAEDCKQVSELGAVDDAQTEEFIDTGDRVRVFQLRQPRIGYVKLLIIRVLCYRPAKFFHFPGRDAEAVAKLPQMISGPEGVCHG